MALIKCSTEQVVEDCLLRQIQQCVDRSDGPIFSVGLSGGSLPSLLARVLPKVVTDWRKWIFFFCDERIVSFDSEESTFGVYKRNLLSKFSSINEKQFVTIDESLSQQQMAEDYERRMKDILGDRSLDLALLGMGPDGHTCSLFPGHDLSSKKWITLVTDSPKPPPVRITMSLEFLEKKCLKSIFVCLGKSKALVLKEIFVEKKTFPSSLVKSKSIVWILDNESASLIPQQMFSE